MNAHPASHADQDEDFNLVALWLRTDAKRWLAGILAGAFAGAVALGVAMAISAMSGREFWYAAKLLGTAILGPFATEVGLHMDAVLAGFVVMEAICIFWGLVYAHFTQTNQLGPLLAMGVVWGLFSWIFIWNLFLPAFQTIYAAHISPAAAFPICLAYGISMTSVAFFDRMVRGGR
jgi:hypothetical protein